MTPVHSKDRNNISIFARLSSEFSSKISDAYGRVHIAYSYTCCVVIKQLLDAAKRNLIKVFHIPNYLYASLSRWNLIRWR